MRSLDDILAQLRALQPDLCRRYPIRSMGVFGSYVRGEQRDDSDALGVPVDLVEREALRPTLANQVLSEVVPL